MRFLEVEQGEGGRMGGREGGRGREAGRGEDVRERRKDVREGEGGVGREGG